MRLFLPHRLTAIALALLGAVALTATVSAYASTSKTKHNEAKQNLKEWTLLVFLNGKNDLDQYGTQDLLEMQKVGTNANINIVVEWGSLANGTTQRLLVHNDPTASTVTSPVLENRGKVDMGDWTNLRDFIVWGAANYPAKKYFVSVWNHGSGWHAAKLGSIRPTDISFDDETGNAINTVQFGQAIKEASQSIGQKIDLLGADACLMAMVEVAAEFGTSARHFVASQELEPGEGWPYDKVLMRLDADPTMDSKNLGQVLSEEYLASYSGGSQGQREVTLSVMDLSKMVPFLAAFRMLALEVGALTEANAKVWHQAMRRVQRFDTVEYRDFGDYVRVLNTAVSNGSLVGIKKATLQRAQNSLQTLITTNVTSSSYVKATGASFHLPTDTFYYQRYQYEYERLAFDRATNWSAALGRALSLAETPSEDSGSP